MQEELGLSESEVEGLRLRYITHRLTNGEIRQNYYFFGRLREDRPLESTEGNLRWVPLEEVPTLEMPVSAKHMILHYLREGRFTDHIYCGITEEETTNFVIMRDF
jgi:8-oxo-dGTP diphosphatase